MTDRFARPPDEAERAQVFARIQAQCLLPLGEQGCWLWRGNNADAASRKPMVRFRGGPVAVRRVVFFLQHGFEPPPGMFASGCGVPGCVGPHCVHALPRTAVMRRSARAGRCSSPEAMRSRKAAAQARALYSEDVVALVRELQCSAAEAARITGMSKAHIINIRAGRARTPVDAPPPSPRGTRQQAAIRRAALAATERSRAGRLERLAAAQEVAGIWGGLLR